LGAVDTQVLCPAPRELSTLLSSAFEVESRSWKSTASTALTRDETRGAFFREYCDYASRRGELRLCFLTIGGRPVACQIAVASGGAFWLLKVGYDQEFSRCSPGNLLVSETIRYAADQGLRSYEFLGTAEPWTKVWSSHERDFVSVYAYPRTPTGIAAFGADIAAAARRRLSRQAP
jgi:CelD/BcsL family acetyltransferase involved in cellulose biosynthesis